jgi:hypothetical protein
VRRTYFEIRYTDHSFPNVRVSHANNAFASMTVLPLTGTVLNYRDFVSFTRDTFCHLWCGQCYPPIYLTLSCMIPTDNLICLSIHFQLLMNDSLHLSSCSFSMDKLSLQRILEESVACISTSCSPDDDFKISEFYL